MLVHGWLASTPPFLSPGAVGPPRAVPTSHPAASVQQSLPDAAWGHRKVNGSRLLSTDFGQALAERLPSAASSGRHSPLHGVVGLVTAKVTSSAMAQGHIYVVIYYDVLISFGDQDHKISQFQKSSSHVSSGHDNSRSWSTIKQSTLKLLCSSYYIPTD